MKMENFVFLALTYLLQQVAVFFIVLKTIADAL